MKKLISLLAAISVVSACSLSAFASEFTINGSETNKLTATDAATQTTYEKGENGLYTVDLSSVAGDQDQTTILAVKGNNIAVGSIQYIGQSADKTFSFDLKDNLTEQVNVLAGGSKISPTLVGNMKPAQTQTGYTISGAVSNFVSQSFIDDELIPYVEEVFAGDTDAIAQYKADYTKGYATTARLYNKAAWTDSLGSEYLAYYESGETVPEALQVVAVDTTSGEYKFEKVSAGDYVLVLERGGALPYFKYVTVGDSNVAVDTITLSLGDSLADYAVDFTDVSNVVLNMDDLGGELFTPANDVNTDLAIDFTDVSTIISNMTDIWAYGEEAIDDLVQ